jgi:SAM-dependent methyltransferase
MRAIYKAAKTSWRVVAPSWLNDFAFGGHTPVSRFVLAIKARLEQSATHDDIYDESYYLKYSDEVARSARGIVATLQKRIAPASVIDVGCGSGEIIREFAARGTHARGLDYSDAALALCKRRGLDVQKCDLEGDLNSFSDLSADLVLSTEVAEHLPAAYADQYVGLLCAIARRFVVITAATPGQGGTDHVNEQPFSYWIEKFESRGTKYVDDLTKDFRHEWQAVGVDPARASNVLVFAVANSAAELRSSEQDRSI